MMEVACMLQYQVDWLLPKFARDTEPTPEELERLREEKPARPTAGSTVSE